MADRVLKVTSPLMSGDDVKEFQTLVTQKGFSCGSIDGKYGEKAKEACKGFQKSAGLSQDGICGADTWKALRGRRMLKVRSPLMEGSDVKEFQNLVKSHGYDCGSVDGKYGKKAESACKKFQSSRGLSADGICGDDTWAELDKDVRRTLKVTNPLMSGDDVKEFQNLVKKHGFNPGSIDGKYGDNCESACKKFQQAKGLSADGICGKNTWAALDKSPSTSKPSSAHFKMEEFKCKDGTQVPAEYYGNCQKLMNMLEEIRTACGNRAITINSGYRTPSYNKKVGGASKSQHLYASAADIRVSGMSASEVYKICDKLVGSRGGVGKYSSFTHVDVRGNRARWNG